MSEQKPSVGRIVHYKLASHDKPEDFNFMRLGESVAAVIVRVWSTNGLCTCNLKLLHDGPEPALWRTSVEMGDEPGQWSWPPRV